jgi:regulator of sigma E protease
VHVEAFSIGFGQALASWTDRHGTQWKIAWLPLGGYVKLHGQERPEDVSEEVRRGWQEGRTFHGKGVGSRAIVVAAGPIANFLLAIVIFAGLFATVGKPEAEATAPPVVGQVIADSAASRAGLQSGDRVEAIDTAPVGKFEDIQSIVSSHPSTTMQLTVLRAGHTEQLSVTTGAREADGKRIGVLGITAGVPPAHRLDPLSAVVAGASYTADITVQTVAGLWQMIDGHRGTEDLGGPIRIAQLSGQVAQLGFASLLSFIAVLSVNLGLINLFPIPILDGGHLLFYAAEALRGRPIPQRAQEYGYRAGFALLACLFVFATWNDLTHIGVFRWVAGLIG